MTSRSQMANPLLSPLLFLYQLLQWLLDKALSPGAPRPNGQLRRPRVAIIGAGVTGITAASHICGHGYDVVIFEAGSEEQLGGIWSKVNESSGLQIHSLMYRFHPSVQWEQGYPDRNQILTQVRLLWKRYGLQNKTRFNFCVDRVYQDAEGRWIINDPSHGRFQGLVAAVGTCGEPNMPQLPDVDKFRGPVLHSSELTGKSAKGKRVVVVGGGASAIEAFEWAHQTDAAFTTILSRSDKWIIPRDIIVNALLSLNVFGQETSLSFIPAFLLRRFFYRDLAHLAPEKGLFTDTPMVNSDIMTKLRDGSAEWVRCDIEGFDDGAVVVNRRARGVPKGGPGHREVIDADVVVMATGFKRPSLAFLPDDCFREPYQSPNWYLQTFPPEHPSLSAINCTYVAGIGSVGNWHIGIYTRILLMFLIDPLTRPSPFWMKRWIDMTRFLKRNSPVGAFDFFTYLELLWWFSFCVAINPFRWKWAVFVLFGVGMSWPRALVRQEEKLLNGDGYRFRDQGSSL